MVVVKTSALELDGLGFESCRPFTGYTSKLLMPLSAPILSFLEWREKSIPT